MIKAKELLIIACVAFFLMLQSFSPIIAEEQSLIIGEWIFEQDGEKVTLVFNEDSTFLITYPDGTQGHGNYAVNFDVTPHQLELTDTENNETETTIFEFIGKDKIRLEPHVAKESLSAFSKAAIIATKAKAEQEKQKEKEEQLKAIKSVQSANELYVIGYKYEKTNTVLAIASYQEILERFPDSELSIKSIDRLDRLQNVSLPTYEYDVRVINFADLEDYDSLLRKADQYQDLLNEMSKKGRTFDHIAMGVAGVFVVFRIDLNDDNYRLDETKLIMRAIGTALDSYQIDNNSFPLRTSEIDWNKDILPRTYFDGARQDIWGTPFRYWSDGTNYRIISYGKDKVRGGDGLDSDIVYSDGEFFTP